jgi:LuxR family quorum sensing-dependent transcriptional regulator
MQSLNVSYAFDQIANFDRARNTAELTAALGSAVKRFGFKSCAIVAFPDPNIPFADCFLAEDHPEGWLDHYLSQKYEDVDPVIDRVRTLFRPFEWSAKSLSPGLGPKAMQMMDDLAGIGIVSGFVIPTYTRNGPVLAGFAGAHETLSAENKGALSMIGFYAQLRATELLGGATSKVWGKKPLSPRETEVLKWCSEGKTTREISEILGLSPHTIITHINNVCRKLKAPSRTAAVSKALRARLI